jgi:hypothetical protein
MSSLTSSFSSYGAPQWGKTTSFSSSGGMSFWAIPVVSLFISASLFIGIATIWQFLRQKISDEISVRATKIANDLSAHDTKTFDAELGRIYAEINDKLTTEIRKINSRDANYATEAQKILSMVSNLTTKLNTIEEACRDNFGRFTTDFTSINASIEALQHEMIRHYANTLGPVIA